MTGIYAYDLAAPERPLVPRISPLRNPPSAAEIAADDRRRREEADRSYSAVLTQWSDLRALAEGDPVAVAVLHVHQPQRGHDHAECDECKTDEDYEATPARWPCATFEAVRTAIAQRGGGG